MWVVFRLYVFCEPFTDRAFGFPYILFFTFFTFNHICKVSMLLWSVHVYCRGNRISTNIFSQKLEHSSLKMKYIYQLS